MLLSAIGAMLAQMMSAFWDSPSSHVLTHPSVASHAPARARSARTSWPLRARACRRDKEEEVGLPATNANGGDMPVATVLHGESPQLT